MKRFRELESVGDKLLTIVMMLLVFSPFIAGIFALAWNLLGLPKACASEYHEPPTEYISQYSESEYEDLLFEYECLEEELGNANKRIKELEAEIEGLEYEIDDLRDEIEYLQMGE